MSIYTSKTIQKMPDILLYKLTDNVYRIINTKNAPNAIHAGDIKISTEMRNRYQEELWIDALILNSNQRNQGIGTKILKFAENLSKQMGLNGRLGVRAATLDFTSDTPPHKFYRKFGFGSDDKKMNKFIDEFIECDEKLDFLKMPPVEMHYTPKNQPLKQKFLDWFYNLFS